MSASNAETAEAASNLPDNLDYAVEHVTSARRGLLKMWKVQPAAAQTDNLAACLLDALFELDMALESVEDEVDNQVTFKQQARAREAALLERFRADGVISKEAVSGPRNGASGGKQAVLPRKRVIGGTRRNAGGGS